MKAPADREPENAVCRDNAVMGEAPICCKVGAGPITKLSTVIAGPGPVNVMVLGVIRMRSTLILATSACKAGGLMAGSG